MLETFSNGGIMMWPLLAVAIGIVVLTVRTAARLRAAARAPAERPAPEVDRWLQAILFWGAMAVLLGLLGTVVGLVVMAQAIALAGGVEPRLAWAGVGVVLVTLLFGLLIFVFASTSWFTLRQWAVRLAG